MLRSPNPAAAVWSGGSSGSGSSWSGTSGWWVAGSATGDCAATWAFPQLWTSCGRPSPGGTRRVNEAQRLWDECAGILQAQVSEPVWLTSFEAARPTRLEGNVLTLAVPSFLAKERIEGRYLSLVRGALTEVGAADVELALEIAPNEPEPQWTVAPPTAVPRRQRDGEVHDINPRYTFDTFVIGPSNRFAHAAALAVAETPGPEVQPAVRLRRRRPRQDPPAPGHRPLRPGELPHLPGALRHLRGVPQRVHRRRPHRLQRRLQAPLPRHRRAAGRRHPVHRGQEGDPGGVLPHLQPPPPGQPADRAVARTGRPTPSAPWRTGSAAGSSRA